LAETLLADFSWAVFFSVQIFCFHGAARGRFSLFFLSPSVRGFTWSVFIFLAFFYHVLFSVFLSWGQFFFIVFLGFFCHMVGFLLAWWILWTSERKKTWLQRATFLYLEGRFYVGIDDSKQKSQTTT
jgi:hypothetical protein